MTHRETLVAALEAVTATRDHFRAELAALQRAQVTPLKGLVSQLDAAERDLARAIRACADRERGVKADAP